MTVPTTSQENQASPAQAEAQKPNDKEYNFAQVRKQLEQERQARMQAEEKASRLEQEQKQARKPYKDDDDDEEDSSNEPYVDHKTLKKQLKKALPQIKEETKKELREEVRREFEQEKQQSYVKQNPDFTQVLTEENIQKFAEKHPSIAERMLRMPDNFDRQALLYEQIKALQLHKKEEPQQTIQKTIDNNRKSPYYQPSGVGTSPYAAVGDFSPAGQKNAYAKLQEMKAKLRI